VSAKQSFGLERGNGRRQPPDAKRTTQVNAWLESPSIVLLAETDHYWQTLRSLLEEGRLIGPRVHDARIAAVCLLHGVRKRWTADRDFGRFGELTVRNPLVA